MRKAVKQAIGWATVMVAGRVYVYHFWPDGTVTRRPPASDFTVAVEEVSLPVRGQVIARNGSWPKGAFVPDARDAVETLRRSVEGKTWSELQ